jgi:hypothetical protein
MVEGVEDLRSELHVHFFGYRRTLHEREIHTCETCQFALLDFALLDFALLDFALLRRFDVRQDSAVEAGGGNGFQTTTALPET